MVAVEEVLCAKFDCISCAVNRRAWVCGRLCCVAVDLRSPEMAMMHCQGKGVLVPHVATSLCTSRMLKHISSCCLATEIDIAFRLPDQIASMVCWCLRTARPQQLQ
jgi:hypothetical protein